MHLRARSRKLREVLASFTDHGLSARRLQRVRSDWLGEPWDLECMNENAGRVGCVERPLGAGGGLGRVCAYWGELSNHLVEVSFGTAEARVEILNRVRALRDFSRRRRYCPPSFCWLRTYPRPALAGTPRRICLP